MIEPRRGIQTVTVPAGGAVIVEFKLDVPGNYILVDHALSRAERGLVGILHVEGQPIRRFLTARSNRDPGIDVGKIARSSQSRFASFLRVCT